MSIEHLLIILSIVIISGSGIVINLQKRGTSNRHDSSFDNHSLTIFRILMPISLMAAYLVYVLGFSPLQNHNNPELIVGSILVITGLIIRWTAISQLGKYFTVKIGIQQDQALVTTGLYKIIRHPSYTGMLIYYIGLGMLMENLVSLLILFGFSLIAILYRIKFEEKVLKQHFGNEFQNYKSSTYKLIPFVF